MGNAEAAETFAIRYCKDTFKDQCDIIVRIVRKDDYKGSFI